MNRVGEARLVLNSTVSKTLVGAHVGHRHILGPFIFGVTFMYSVYYMKVGVRIEIL